MFHRAQNFTDEERIITKSVDPSIQGTPAFSPIKAGCTTILFLSFSRESYNQDLYEFPRSWRPFSNFAATRRL